MSETPSSMIPLGTKAPYFKLVDTVTHTTISLNDIAQKVTVVMFICNHCPYVKLILPKLIELANNYKNKDVGFVAISSNDIHTYPEDSPDKMHALAIDHAFPFPYLYDEDQSVAKAYHATCTPDFFVFDQDLKCVYRGRFDEATPGNNKTVTGNELSYALNCLLEGKSIDAEQFPSVGCNIKWIKE